MEVQEAYDKLKQQFDLDSLKYNKDLFEQFKLAFEKFYIELHKERLSGKGAGLLARIHEHGHITRAQSQELINYLLRDEGAIAQDFLEIYQRASQIPNSKAF